MACPKCCRGCYYLHMYGDRNTPTFYTCDLKNPKVTSRARTCESYKSLDSYYIEIGKMQWTKAKREKW